MVKPIIGPQPATAAVVQGAVQPQFGEVRIRQRGRLPHWEKDAGLYFLTFHLADSLPLPVLEKMAERHRILIAAWVNVSCAIHVMANWWPTLCVSGRESGIGSWPGVTCPNPCMWSVCRLLPGQELSKVLQGWKSFTARKANEILGRGGAFWQREYYDRLIRNGDELERAVSYVVNNPERAGLKGWKWVWSAGEDARATAGLETGATNECRD